MSLSVTACGHTCVRLSIGLSAYPIAFFRTFYDCYTYASCHLCVSADIHPLVSIHPRNDVGWRVCPPPCLSASGVAVRASAYAFVCGTAVAIHFIFKDDGLLVLVWHLESVRVVPEGVLFQHKSGHVLTSIHVRARAHSRAHNHERTFAFARPRLCTS